MVCPSVTKVLSATSPNPWDTVSVATVNTNGIKQNGHLFVDTFLFHHSLSCVQETKFADARHLDTFKFHLDSSFAHKLFVNDPNVHLDRPSRGRSGGVLTLLRSDFPGFETATDLSHLSVPGRYLVVRLSLGLKPLYIHNVYAPVDRQEKQHFFSCLPTGVFEDNATHFVLGDLNTPLDPRLDCVSPAFRSDPGRPVCLEWLARLGVVDAWRLHSPTARVFTGPLPRKNRLDYILLSEQFCDSFYHKADYFVPRHAGDHLAHKLSLRSGKQLHGRGYWKLPQYLLDYPSVVSAIGKEAELVRDRLLASSNPGTVWDEWKSTIRRQLQDVQKKLRQQETRAVTAARASLDRAAARYRVSSTADDCELFATAMHTYTEAMLTSSQYCQDSAFDFHAANSERSTRHFFRPLNPCLRRISIEEVVTPHGTVSTHPQEISLRFLEHWGSEMGDVASPGGMAPAPDATDQLSLLDSVERFVSEPGRAVLDAELTSADLAAAIRHMKASSSPGMDGLTAGFYQVAPDIFGECLAIVFADRLRRGTLLVSQRKSAVVLLHKKGSRADPGNYRPIALIPVDVKVLSKALTHRLHCVMRDLVHPDQKGFIKGRSIHHHVRFLGDLQDLVTSRDEEAYALFLDFQKAFDRVNWEYLFRLLARMGFGPNFIGWVRLLYTKPQAHLLLNGNIQPALYPTRGVKQGDPLSALLFVLTLEPLTNLLRAHEEHGVCLSADHTATGMFFADDSTLLASSIPNLQAQLTLVATYCAGSGARLNLSKSVLLALNRRVTCPELPGVHVLRRSDTTKYLGIPFGQHSVDNTIVEFLDQRFYDGIKAWYRRARTLRGRLLVAQTMVLSRLWHYTPHVLVPLAVVRRWQSMLNRFVLSRKHDRDAQHVQLIPADFLYQRRCDGGLGIPTLNATLKRQRLGLLLQFMSAAGQLCQRDWTTAGAELLTSGLPRYGGRTALDFLTISPLRHGELITLSRDATWWRTTWTWWYKTRWEVTWHHLPPDERAQNGLHQPVWFHADAVLHYEQTPRRGTTLVHRRCLGMVPEPQRSFRLHISRTFRLRSLVDFARVGEAWPVRDTFVQRHLDLTLLSVSPFQQMTWLRTLYREATQIVDRLGARHLVRLSSTFSPPQRQLPHLGCMHAARLCLIPTIPKTALLHVVWKPPPPRKPHPLTIHSPRVDEKQLQAFTHHGQRLRRILLPIFDDLQFRLAFRLLPVRSRFWFLELTRPGIRVCACDGCNAIETERHLFFECTLASQLWQQVSSLVSPFFSSRPSWLDIALARRLRLRDDWTSSADIVHDVWHVLRAVTLHTLWTNRNRCLFDGRAPLPPAPALAVVLSTFGAHVRFFQRRLYTPDDTLELQRILAVLQRNVSFRASTSPCLLSVRGL